MQFTMHEAKNHLCELVERALKGERIVIARSGKPCVDLIPHNRHGTTRKPGRYKGQIVIKEDLDAVNNDIQTAFEGR